MFAYSNLDPVASSFRLLIKTFLSFGPLFGLLNVNFEKSSLFYATYMKSIY